MLEKFKIITDKKPSIQNNWVEKFPSPYHRDQYGYYTEDGYL